jgi:hypothetical protein
MTDRPDIFDLVKADLDARNAKGRETYGGTLRPFDGRDSHRDLYEELLDAVMYERKRQVEREAALVALEDIEYHAQEMFPSTRKEYERALAVIRAALEG